MEQTCIVCLSDLRISLDDRSASEADPSRAVQAADDATQDVDAKTQLRNTRLSSKRAESDEEIIAHLLPCNHELHNECLKPWVERANSCPICRATFNTVELSKVVGGEVIDSYVVRDKVQEADIDPTMVVEDELFAADIWEPCMLCGAIDDGHEVMYCDGCDKAVHVFCAGLDDSPDVWYCATCLADLEDDTGVQGLGNAVRRRRQGTRSRPARRSHRSDRVWNRIWQEVSRRLDMDLDFPFADEDTGPRTDEQRRELAHWQQRLAIASRQGAADRLRGLARAHLDAQEHGAEPESQEELRAWNAFDKARELQDAPDSIRRKRKRTRTASPAEPAEPDGLDQQEPRRQKRPRLRRPQVQTPNPAESSAAAASRVGEGSTFLSNLLREVENNPVSAASPDTSDVLNGHHSPGPSSPVGSPMSSGQSTPRALSVTPPPLQRPISPPLSSTILPYTPTGQSPTFSPFSPIDPDGANQKRVVQRGRRHENQTSYDSDNGRRGRPRASSTSPSRIKLSYSAKEEIQRMVKLALAPRYREKEISKDQYTDINRDVSRKMYDLVGTASALEDHTQREKWQGVAEAEVRRAIATSHFGPESTNDLI